MKSLATLIKLYSRQLDDRRREMVALELEKQQLEAALAAIREELKREQDAAAASSESRFAYSNYATANNKRQQQFIQEIGSLEVKIFQLAHTISLLFTELKKYEIALENKSRQLEAEETRKENIRLGDIALNSFSRKEKEDE